MNPWVLAAVIWAALALGLGIGALIMAVNGMAHC